MKKWLLIFLALLIGTPAYAVDPIYALNFGQQCPGSSALCQPTAPKLIYTLNFMGSVPSGVNFSRASTGWYFDSNGLLASAGTNVARFDYGSPGSTTLVGMLIEPARTNQLLYSRDLTQSNWTKANATAALDQVGIDGVASSASSFAATSSNATICQTITQAAASSVFTVYLKRLSGSGAVSISQDGGASYSTVTTTSAWTRAVHASQGTLNPTMCIKLATSGDSIGVDVTQFEAGLYRTTPIVTASATVTRASDFAQDPSPSRYYNTSAGAFVAEWQQISCGPEVQFIAGFGFDFGANYYISVNNTNIQNPKQNFSTFNATENTTFKAGATYGPNLLFSAATNGTSFARSIALSTMPPSLNFGGCPMWIRRFTYWNFTLTAAQLRTLTQ